MHRLLLVVILCLSGLHISAQLDINEEPDVTQLMAQYRSMNLQKPIIKAWRIQIITTDDRREMENAKSKFQRLYPHIDYSWEHVAPYYKVKIGAYEKKEDLEGFLLQLKRDFPFSLPVQDDIEKSELIKAND
jgi:hypothetical protein